jgi:hypothetical protein
MRRALLTAATAMIVSRTLGAQSVQGTVLDANGRPVAGVVVVLLDSNSVITGRSLSNEAGIFRLTGPRPGTYVVRSTRIGYRPFLSKPMHLASGEIARPEIRIAGVTLALDTIRVQGANACKLTARDSAAVAWKVWEQVRAALTAGQVTARERAFDATILSYERTLDLARKTVVKQDVNMRTERVREPWRVVPYEELRKRGYVTDSADYTTYLAPGIDALLADDFLEDHCFRLSTSDPRRIGVEFGPTRDRGRVAEIKGTVWVDRASSELRGLDFSYTNVDRDIAALAGGDMQFVRFANGGWAISRWNIRMPVLALVENRNHERISKVGELRVSGGELVSATRASGKDTLWVRAPIHFAGLVVDSTSQRPVTGARVNIAGTGIDLRTDVQGRFSTSAVMVGSYDLDVTTPSLDSINASKTVSVVITDSMSPMKIVVPTGIEMFERICRKRLGRGEGTVVGRASLRGDLEPRAGIVVVGTWDEPRLENGRVSRNRHELVARTDSAGTFALCGVPVNTIISLAAKADSLSGASETRIPQGRMVARAELLLDANRVARAIFAGAVLDDSSKSPIPFAEVALTDIGIKTVADARGEFSIRNIPAGTHSTQVRKIGYAPALADLEFAPDVTLRRVVSLSHTVMLDSMIIRGLMRDPQMDDFEVNRKRGLGTFFTRGEIAKVEGMQISDILRKTPGYYVVPRFMEGETWIMNRRQGCYPPTILDAVKIHPGGASGFNINSIPSPSIEAIEIYQGAASIPTKYMGMGTNCGLLVIHTRRDYKTGNAEDFDSAASGRKKPPIR